MTLTFLGQSLGEIVNERKGIGHQDFMNNPAVGGKIRKINTFKTGGTNGK